MKVFVDTSVWIEFFRGKKEAVKKLNDLLDNEECYLGFPVYLEILNGAKASEALKLKRVLAALPLIYPNEMDWNQCESWIILSKVHRFSLPDLLIASLAFREKASLWTLDRDFNRMADLGFVKLFTH